jgi:hypothetical protein
MYSWDNAQVVLVGNKSDLEDERVITTERGKRLADQLGSCWRVVDSKCLDIVLQLSLIPNPIIHAIVAIVSVAFILILYYLSNRCEGLHR